VQHWTDICASIAFSWKRLANWSMPNWRSCQRRELHWTARSKNWLQVRDSVCSVLLCSC